MMALHRYASTRYLCSQMSQKNTNSKSGGAVRRQDETHGIAFLLLVPPYHVTWLKLGLRFGLKWYSLKRFMKTTRNNPCI
jgi:hypothetical protein